MKILRLTVRMLTPAFLGDAQQNARWRTPPFKHALREWWRVAYAASRRFDVDVNAMRRAEGLLFGNAWLENEFCKSQVRMRLNHWNAGTLQKKDWPADTTVKHPEVQRPVGSALYLGYGPLKYENKTTLKANAAIQGGESAQLSIAIPDNDALLLQRAIWLMARYGTLGGRSRNGWGSFALDAVENTPALTGVAPLRSWRECLQRDWPHAIGQDDRPLIWQTQPFDDWKALMRELAIIKIGLRTQFRFKTGRGALTPEERHWLAYPVTNHDVRAWNALRLPNQLRFKVRDTENGKLVGVIFHVPHLPPAAFQPDRRSIERVWERIHGFLDATQKLERIPE